MTNRPGLPLCDLLCGNLSLATQRATKGCSLHFGPKLRYLTRRNPTMSLRYCLPYGLWVKCSWVVHGMPFTSAVWAGRPAVARLRGLVLRGWLS
jgi:hypothetical protein